MRQKLSPRKLQAIYTSQNIALHGFYLGVWVALDICKALSKVMFASHDYGDISLSNSELSTDVILGHQIHLFPSHKPYCAKGNPLYDVNKGGSRGPKVVGVLIGRMWPGDPTGVSKFCGVTNYGLGLYRIFCDRLGRRNLEWVRWCHATTADDDMHLFRGVKIVIVVSVGTKLMLGGNELLAPATSFTLCQSSDLSAVVGGISALAAWQLGQSLSVLGLRIRGFGV